MRTFRFEAVPTGTEFVDLTYGAEWRKLENGQAVCVCGAGQNRVDDVKSFSPHFCVELSTQGEIA